MSDMDKAGDTGDVEYKVREAQSVSVLFIDMSLEPRI